MCHVCIKINDVTVTFFQTIIVHLFVLSSRSWIHADNHGQSIHMTVNEYRSWLKNKEAVGSIERHKMCRQSENALMYMSKTNVIHYSKRIIMDCLFRVVQKRSLWTFIRSYFDIWQIEKRWLSLFLVSSRGVQSIIGVILICLGTLILIFHSLCRFKDKEKLLIKKNNK
jgi:hypothetical protein